jgi:hypothetical protein
MYKNLLTLSLTAVLILQFNSQASAVTQKCSESFTDLTAAVTILRGAIKLCQDRLDNKKGWSGSCLNINTDADPIPDAVKQAYLDCAPQ